MNPTSPSHRPFGFRALMCAVVGMGLTNGCAASQIGSVSDGMYTPRSGDFSVRVPRTIFGTSQVDDGSNEQGSWVQFSSDDGSVWRIEYYPILLSTREMLADSAGRDQAGNVFDHHLGEATRFLEMFWSTTQARSACTLFGFGFSSSNSGVNGSSSPWQLTHPAPIVKARFTVGCRLCSPTARSDQLPDQSRSPRFWLRRVQVIRPAKLSL